jgi:hypothetical protein
MQAKRSSKLDKACRSSSSSSSSSSSLASSDSDSSLGDVEVVAVAKKKHGKRRVVRTLGYKAVQASDDDNPISQSSLESAGEGEASVSACVTTFYRAVHVGSETIIGVVQQFTTLSYPRGGRKCRCMHVSTRVEKHDYYLCGDDAGVAGGI